MLIMPANNCKNIVHYWAGRYGTLGHLYSPGGFKGPFSWLPYALDNGAYISWQRNQPWSEQAFFELCERTRYCHPKPRWILVPDVVANRQATICKWRDWEASLRKYGVPLAFAVQDGMDITDVPVSADVVFIGGSTGWKRQAIRLFCQSFRRGHVGRINTARWLWYCHDAGAESVDGTGWFRGDLKQLQGLENYLKTCAGEVPSEYQLELLELNHA